MHDATTDGRPVGIKLNAMYFVLHDDDTNIAQIGKITGVTKGRGRESTFTASLFHVDPISAGRPDAGIMAMSAEEVFNQWEFFSTYAEAYDVAEWMNKQTVMLYESIRADQAGKPEADHADAS